MSTTKSLQIPKYHLLLDSLFKGTLTSLTLFIAQIDTEILIITVKEIFTNFSYIQRKVQKNISLQWPGGFQKCGIGFQKRGNQIPKAWHWIPIAWHQIPIAWHQIPKAWRQIPKAWHASKEL